MKRKYIAITGGIGSGKSTVLAYLKEKGYPVFSCDEIYKRLFRKESYVRAIKAVFPDAVNEKGIDRERLALLVFSDENARKQLNSIAHPLIMKELFSQMDACGESLCFAEVPLLFENGSEKDFDEVLVVMRDKTLRIQSVQERDVKSVESVKKRMEAQFNYDEQLHQEKLQKENVILLYNNTNVQALYKEIERYLAKL